MVVTQHVDEVNDDNAAQIAQPELPCNGLCGFKIGLENGFVKVARTHKTAGVDVDRGQRFGLVNDEVAARFEFNPAAQCTGDFFVDVQ